MRHLFLALLLLPQVWPQALVAQNNDWPRAIAAVTESSDAYIAYAQSKTDNMPIQSMIGVVGLTVDVERHRCAILGRMLGKQAEIEALEHIDYPPLNDQLDPFEAAEFGTSLANWVGAAQTALAANEADRINTWNLDCAGHMGIPLAARIGNLAPEAQFQFRFGTLNVYGDIDAGFYDRFLAQLDQHPDVTTIALGSGGGSVKDALLAGREIRKRGLETTLQGNCYSACPLVFAGGQKRILWAAVRHDFGFHQLATRDGTALPDDHAFYDLIGDYVTEMGVDADIYLGWMRSAPPQDMYSPEPWDLCAPILATFVQRICLDGKRF